MVADGADVVVAVLLAGSVGLVWIRLFRSILLGKYGSIVCLFCVVFWMET